MIRKNAIHEVTIDICRDDKRKAKDVSFVKDQASDRIAKFWTHDSAYDSKTSAKQVGWVSQNLPIMKRCNMST